MIEPRQSTTVPNTSNVNAFTSRAIFSSHFAFPPPEEELQEIVQEPPAERGRTDPHVVALDEPLRLGRGERPVDGRDLQAGALGEERDVEPVGEAQRVHHELEPELAALDRVPLLHRVAAAARARYSRGCL